MQISFVSDVHGNYDALARAARDADKLVVLGDLLDYVDYHDPAAGILGEVFGAERVGEFAVLRARGDFPGLHRLNSDLWGSVADPVGTLAEVVAARYSQALAALSLADRQPLVILGNVDMLDVWREVAGDRFGDLDGRTVSVGGLRLGFVAGGASRRRRPAPGGPAAPTEHALVPGPAALRAWRPYVRPADDYRAAVAGLGEIDVLCSHVPPGQPLLRYDTVTARLEMFGPGLLDLIDSARPRLAVFGHVHQPLAARLHRGRTACVNVGHFARHRRAFWLEC